MKKIAFFSFLLATGILHSCRKDLNPFTVGIDVQSSFNQDRVQVFMDGRDILNKSLQTNYALGVCYVDGQTTTTGNIGRHEIKVIVNNSITRTESFSLHNDLYIGINYNQQTSEISFVYSSQRFIYD